MKSSSPPMSVLHGEWINRYHHYDLMLVIVTRNGLNSTCVLTSLSLSASLLMMNASLDPFLNNLPPRMIVSGPIW